MDTKDRPPDRSALKYAILIAVTMAVIVFILFFMWRSRAPEELSSEHQILTHPPGAVQIPEGSGDSEK